MAGSTAELRMAPLAFFAGCFCALSAGCRPGNLPDSARSRQRTRSVLPLPLRPRHRAEQGSPRDTARLTMSTRRFRGSWRCTGRCWGSRGRL